MTDDKTPTQKGEAFGRLLTALAAIAPQRPERSQFINSVELASAHTSRDRLWRYIASPDSSGKASLTESRKRNAAKAVGRMISAGAFREVIVPNGKHPKVNLPESGMIAVSVSLSELNALHSRWVEGGKIGPKPSQELIAENIRTQSLLWALDNSGTNGLPVLLKDIWIVHGSGSFDMLVMVMYRQSDDFMTYIREVIQRTEGVHNTHTMQISTMLSDEA